MNETKEARSRIFGERLRKLRRESDLTQEELAKYLSVSKGRISYYESAERNPNMSFIIKAARHFNCSSDYLIGKSLIRRPSPPASFTFTEYQKKAQRTANPALTSEQKLYNALYGLNGEAGELLDLIKKRDFQGHAVPLQLILNEAGDVLWYLAELAAATDTGLDMIAQMNIEKLEARYPDGFSSDRSVNRDG